MTRSGLVLILALLAVCTAPVMATSILLNGSFEDPQIAGNFYMCVAAPAGTCNPPYIIPAIPGWTVRQNGVDVVQGPTWSHDGTQGIDMAGTPGPGSLSQTLTTTPAASYTLSFWVSSNGGAIANSLTVDRNGTPLATISTPAQNTWQEYSFMVTGTGSDSLAFIGNIGGNAGALLDQVSVDIQAPEPATFGLIGAGLVLIAFRFRRR